MTKSDKGYRLLSGSIVVLTAFYLMVDFVFRKYPELDSFSALVWGYGGSMLITSLIFFILPKTRKRMIPEWRENKYLSISVGISVAIAASLLVYGIKNAGSGPVILLENTQVIFAVLLGFILLKEKLKLREGLSGLVMLIGIAFIAGLKGEINLASTVACIFAALFYAVQSLLVKKYGHNAHSLHLAHTRGIVTFFIVTFVALFIGKFEVIPYPAIILLTFAYFIAITVSRYLFFEAHKYLNVAQINTFVLLQPVLVLIGALFLFGDPISTQKIFGATLILGGGFCFVRCKGKASKIEQPVILSD